MLMKWAKILPYWILMWAVRNMGGADGCGKLIVGDEYDIQYFQLSEGEFVVFSKEIQERFNERKESKRVTKRNKKLDKINTQLRDDWKLRNELKEQFEMEKELQSEDDW